MSNNMPQNNVRRRGEKEKKGNCKKNNSSPSLYKEKKEEISIKAVKPERDVTEKAKDPQKGSLGGFSPDVTSFSEWDAHSSRSHVNVFPSRMTTNA